VCSGSRGDECNFILKVGRVAHSQKKLAHEDNAYGTDSDLDPRGYYLAEAGSARNRW